MRMQPLNTSGGHRVLVEATGPEIVAWGRAAALVAIGCLSLAAGILVYLTDRAASHALLIPAVAALAGQHRFGAVGLWLPSFAHPLAFSVFSAVALPPRSAPPYGICAAWCAIDIAFEIGQHPMLARPLAALLINHADVIPAARSLANYFVRGTFDVSDMLATVLGALAAAAVLFLLRSPQEQIHVQ
jgi:hypothetical protein